MQDASGRASRWHEMRQNLTRLQDTRRKSKKEKKVKKEKKHKKHKSKKTEKRTRHAHDKNSELSCPLDQPQEPKAKSVKVLPERKPDLQAW